ncbi:hypothetical protein [Nocardiopsis sp. CC223A]|uniref:hypothetical protein n=1 Tax=Nocardiopsis sp. CC223A TaxID=3044051 RepID=UPI00278C82E6|nr:hypothetical protein [Nocardiopsis sp. CC223A]
MRAIGIITGRVLARRKPATTAMIAHRARANRIREVAADWEAAIARELAARGEAARLYRTEGPSAASRRAAQAHLRAQTCREALEGTLFRLRAHQSVPA